MESLSDTDMRNIKEEKEYLIELYNETAMRIHLSPVDYSLLPMPVTKSLEKLEAIRRSLRELARDIQNSIKE